MIECNSIEEVRENINQIDEEIVKLIAKRAHFVKQAAKFKKNTSDVCSISDNVSSCFTIMFPLLQTSFKSVKL